MNEPKQSRHLRPSRGWRRAIGAAALVAGIQVASGHPLGQQSVDHYSQVEITPRKVMVVYTLDMAEIATFQEVRRADTNGDGKLDDAEKAAYATSRARALAAGLHLEINGHPLPLAPSTPKVFLRPGDGGLTTLRLMATMETASGALAGALRETGPQSGAFRDDNDLERVGWRQIGVSGIGTRILDRTVDGRPATATPQGYTADAAGDQANVRAVTFHFAPGEAGDAPAQAAPAQAERPMKREHDPFAALMTPEHLTPARMLLFLLAAAALGGLHALSPGHGKTLVAAYLVGSRGTPRHALILGLIVTVAHTAGVFALGLVTLFGSRYLLPETFYPWLTAASGLVIAQVGLWRLFGRGHHQHGHGHSHRQEGAQVHSHEHEPAEGGAHEHGHGHEHAGEHDHEHEHGHSHHGHHTHSDEHERDLHHGHSHLLPAGEPVTGRSLLALGISGGIVPCPSALVVLLSAVALHQIAFGLLLIVSFSIGLAGVLTAIGIAVVRAHHFLSKRAVLPGWFFPVVQRLGAAVVTIIGVAIALPAVVSLVKKYAG